MKKCGVSILIFLFSLLCTKGNAQSHEIQQLLLDVEKLAQLKNILADLKKGYQILSAGYGTINNISQGNFSMHKAFLDALLDVSPVVKNYRRVADVIVTQLRIVSDYRRAYRQFAQSGKFTPGELAYFDRIYSNLFTASVNNLEALAKVVTAGKLRMSDDERLTAIDAVWNEAEDQLAFLTHFNNEAKVLAIQRAKDQNEVSVLKNLYNLPK